MEGTFHDNAARSQFELDVNGQLAFATYERRGPVLVVKYVEAAPPLRGTGAADKLMRGVAEAARTEGRKIKPLCGYAWAWLRRHKQYRDLLD